MRWQVAFAKVREKTGVARRNQHRIALTNKEYLMYTNSRGSCTKMVRSLESYDRSTWMEKEEISYKRFTEGLLDEAETWVTKNFEDMQSALEPVVLSEPKRQYDMNEFERMLRMNEQENEWLDTQRRKTDELMDVHVRLVSRSTASMADSIAKVKQALTSLVNEIAEGAELYELARKQKLLQTALEEFEDRYARELETLKTEYGKLKRAVETAQSALVKDKERYNQFWRNLLASLKSKISDQLDVLGQAHIQRIRRQCEVHERQGIMRRSTLEKEEARIRQELTDLRQEIYEARLLLFELKARAGEVSETGEPAEGEVLRKLWKTGDATNMPETGGPTSRRRRDLFHSLTPQRRTASPVGPAAADSEAVAAGSGPELFSESATTPSERKSAALDPNDASEMHLGMHTVALKGYQKNPFNKFGR
eukprot:s4457_g1.t1